MNSNQLNVLDGWELTIGGRAIVIRGRKQKALLTYLAAETGKTHSRKALANLLWGNVPDAQARASLRQCIAGIRADLGEHASWLLQSNDLGLNFVTDAVTIDAQVVAFNPILHHEDSSIFRCSDSLRNLLSIFHGLSETFDEWLDDYKYSLCASALSRFKTYYIDENVDVAVRMSFARAALIIDPLVDEAVRACMQCDIDLGNAAKALETYDTFYRQLQQELDAEPALATQELAVAIKTGAAPAASQNVHRKTASQPSPSRLIAAGSNATIAVLPFETLGQETVPRFALLALLDRVCGHLSSLAAPDVISSNSTRQYEGQRPRPKEILATLGAHYVMAGSITLSNGTATIVAQIAETASECIIWASTLEYSADDLMSLTLSLPEDLAKVISPSVDVAELRRAHMLPDDALGPYQMVLRAREMLFALEKDNFPRAGELLQRAIEAGPYFALGHLRLAEWHSLGLWEGRAVEANRAALEHHAQKAISLRPDDGRALAFWAHARFMFEREHDSAIELIEHAVDASPNDSETLAYCVVALAHGGRSQDAVDIAERTLKLSPIDPLIVRNEHFASIAHYAQRDYDKASELGLSSFRRSPRYGSNLRATIAALVAADRISETAPLVAQHMLLEPGFSVADFVPRHGFRHEKDRVLYGNRLIAAGLPK